MDPNGEGGTITVPEKVVINGKEFDVTEANELIGLGQKTREYETQWNTKLDKVWPEYGKLTQEKSEWGKQKADYEAKLQTLATKTEAGTETQADIDKAREAARKLGIVLDEDLQKGEYIKKTELDTYLTERERDKEQLREVNKVADDMVAEINGADGRPKFNKKAVIAFANAYNIQGKDWKETLVNAYEAMHSEDLEVWKTNQIKSKQTPGLKTLKGSPTKEPKPITITDDNFKQSLHEKLYGKDE